MVQLAVWLFLHFLKVKSCFALAGCLVEDTLTAQYLLCGDGRLCPVQLIRRLVGTVDILFQGRVSPFLVGEL